MRIAVIGAGAIGAFYGGVLADAGVDVSFIARGQTLEAIRNHGLRIVGNTELTLTVPATDNAAEIGQVDVVLICTKTFQLADAARAHLPALMGSDTLVVTTQNGVIAPQILSEIVGAEHVAPGVCREWVKILEPGLIMDLGGPRMLEVSTMDDSPNPIIDEVRATCEKAGIVSPITDDITTTLWVKMCSVVPQGACGAVLDVALGDLLSTYRDIFARCIAETVQVARGHGAKIADDFVTKNLTFLAGQDPASTTSFQRDILAGRPSEYAAQVGAVPELGDEVGVDTPVNDVIAAVLGRREAENRGYTSGF
ncbi:2-dehydropantoate 2-reductase [Cutibacterium sp.]|uniref:2-dehydropantoate 2-reductase n=1 Tax=Cutibacterium sp. TaxID=1912221 RepID=UPI0026DC76B1|nr:2-dehydropantoate 2-reductase [Cutibacterium sp.]MDO4411798.1 2-dehydropantoate 2-reductase [Cutibacterium sp.]